ncbi:MAG: penicillin acylase family protein [Candidatus Marinimicrobia bacterium]|nr:penicillin acylase family protein [Candidatus Neomarinimicrobiota bacterium]
MKKLKAVLSLFCIFSSVFILNNRYGNIPPLGKFLDPFHGFLALVNSDKYSDDEYIFPNLNDEVKVVIDENHVPHIFAKNEYDLFFTQGYTTAFDRLWQMEFQTHAAGGRLSEIIGENALKYDQFQRRIGMVFAAENGLKETQKYPNVYSGILAYADGVNAYINSLKWDEYPIEYKILDYKPEEWTTLKTLLFLKSMAFSLSGRSSDLDFTKLRDKVSMDVLNDLFPEYPDYIDPIIPKNTFFSTPSIPLNVPDSLYKGNPYQDKILVQPDKRIGSNNWAIEGSRTKSGFPLLSNDPHLQLTLPNIWYQIHLNTPDFNVYGASLPGAPCVISGFNDFISWGETNGGDDVWDWYDIVFKSETMDEYFYDNEWIKTKKRIEEIKIRGKKSFIDTVVYTNSGPIVWNYKDQSKKMYNERNNGGEMISVGRALRWLAHDKSAESKTFYDLNKAMNYDEYVEALKYFTCPVQNFVYADIEGNIAIWHAGNTPAKWKNQGRFIMDGTDPNYVWNEPIPHYEKAHVLNPLRGYVSSANQHVTDNNYPYYLSPWLVESFRGERINQKLNDLDNAGFEEFIQIQMDNKNLMAERVLPILLDTIKNQIVPLNYVDPIGELSKWDYFFDGEKIAPTIYDKWIDYIEKFIWQDDLGKPDNDILWPDYSRLEQLLTKEHDAKWIDNINTPNIETFSMLVSQSFDSALTSLNNDFGELSEKWKWGNSRGTDIYHLAKIPGFGEIDLFTGGGKLIPNATRKHFGPSWRYIVEMSNPPKAKGILPGGQSGYPGSEFYSDMLEKWRIGELRDINSSSNPGEIPGKLLIFKGRE